MIAGCAINARQLMINDTIKSRSNRGTKSQEITKELSVDDQILDSIEPLPNSMPSENTNMEKKQISSITCIMRLV
ncbi:18026_t:CDS:2 [Acaulospora morrowiae]|uniref:18026_t:CDS:1 n=1 Tax=Acaulospora morrowiae TaxID=94023 RepID=A0A9N9F838_9GLOM|nr:18026_t:CDS:2 [Acaulospora morrowiae]